MSDGNVITRLVERIASFLRSKPASQAVVTENHELKEQEPSGPLYLNGAPNVQRMGFISVRHSSGEQPSEDELEVFAAHMGIRRRFIDDSGYEIELIAGAIDPASGFAAYVQSRAKELEQHAVDIDFYMRLRSPAGKEESWPIKSYNPYFGCDVGLFTWMNGWVIFIYREKHETYICKFGPQAPPEFVVLADDWILHNGEIGYQHWGEDQVQRLKLPELKPLAPLSLDEAARLHLLPESE